MPETPEQKARREIDALLVASGWLVQDRADIDLTATRGIAVREFPMKAGFGFADYLLYLDRKALGAVEAKATGTLTGVEAQSAKYASGLPENLQSLLVIADHHAHHPVIGGIRDRQGKDIDLGTGQLVADICEHARFVGEKNRELFGNFHKQED